jgi:hypothetical protein
MTIILPKGFKFRLSKKEFKSRYSTDNKNNNPIDNSSELTMTTRRLPKMQYAYENLLSKLKKEINT